VGLTLLSKVSCLSPEADLPTATEANDEHSVTARNPGVECPLYRGSRLVECRQVGLLCFVMLPEEDSLLSTECLVGASVARLKGGDRPGRAPTRVRNNCTG